MEEHISSARNRLAQASKVQWGNTETLSGMKWERGGYNNNNGYVVELLLCAKNTLDRTFNSYSNSVNSTSLLSPFRG